jgi:hypothetical protein
VKAGILEAYIKAYMKIAFKETHLISTCTLMAGKIRFKVSILQ